MQFATPDGQLIGVVVPAAEANSTHWAKRLQNKESQARTMVVAYTPLNPAEAVARARLWGMESLSAISEVDQLAATTMKIGQKRMYLASVRNTGDEIGPVSSSAVSATTEEMGAVADAFLDGIGLLEHKGELQELTGATWNVEVLSYLEKGDLAETSLGLAEKKMLVAHAAEEGAAVTAARLAEKTAAAAEAVRIAAEEVAAEAEALRVSDEKATTAATLADKFIGGLGLMGHKMELQDALKALLLEGGPSNTISETKEGGDGGAGGVGTEGDIKFLPLQRFFEVVLPPDATPGSIVQCTAPDGQCINITTPMRGRSMSQGKRNPAVVSVPYTSVNPVAAWSMKPLSQLLEMDHLAATTMKIGQKKMFLASTRNMGDMKHMFLIAPVFQTTVPLGAIPGQNLQAASPDGQMCPFVVPLVPPGTVINVSYTPLGSGVMDKAQVADQLLDGIGLMGHKAELQGLTGATWSVQVLSHIEKSDLVETSMSVVEKKMFLKKVMAVASEESAAAEAARELASATAETELIACAKAEKTKAAAASDSGGGGGGGGSEEDNDGAAGLLGEEKESRGDDTRSGAGGEIAV
jgi:hypothetical protein